MPRPVEALPCGSRSMISTVRRRGQRGAEIDGGGGLADAALLVGDGQDAGRARGSGTGRADLAQAQDGGVRGRCGWRSARPHNTSAATAVVNSASAVRPLGNTAIPPGPRRRCVGQQPVQRGEGARGDGSQRRQPARLDPCRRGRGHGTDQARGCLRRKAALRRSASTRWVSASVARWRDEAGQAARRSRSLPWAPSGGSSGRSCEESSDVPLPASARQRVRDEVDAAVPAQQQAKILPQRRPLFHVKQGPRRRLRPFHVKRPAPGGDGRPGRRPPRG